MTTNRYSETDLAEFKANIEQKLEKERTKLQRLEKTYKEIGDAIAEDNDWTDDMSNQNELNLYKTLVYRQRKHVSDYENALQRIYNKSYGICVITGELIDKKRLIAVPTTSKCVTAKIELEKGKNRKEDPEKEETPETTPKPKIKTEPVIISRVIRKFNPNQVAPIETEGFDDTEEDDDDNDYLETEESEETVVDFNSFAAEDSDDNF